MGLILKSALDAAASRGLLREVFFADSQEFASCLLREIAKQWNANFDDWGIDVRYEDGRARIYCPTGHRYEACVLNGWLLLAEQGTDIDFKPAEGPVGRSKPIMAWSMPAESEIGSYYSAETAAHRVVFEGGNWVLKTEAMRTYPAFVDLALTDKLPDATLEELSENFVMLDPRTYPGTFNQIQTYGATFGRLSGKRIAPPKRIEHPDSPLILPYEAPENRPQRLHCAFDWGVWGPRVADVRWLGMKGRLVGSEVWWGERLRYRASSNSVDWLEALVDTREGQRWIAAHALPKIPWTEWDAFFEEFVKLSRTLELPTGEPHAKWNHLEFLRDVWDNLADEVVFMGGVCYHRDNDQWGIVTWMNAGGQGSPTNAWHTGTFFHYYWCSEPSGLIFCATDGCNSSNDTSVGPGWSDFQTRFHADLGENRAAEFVNRFTYST